MLETINSFRSKTACAVIVLVLISTLSGLAYDGNVGQVNFNSEFNLKKTSSSVMVFYTNEHGQKVEYTFESFNADVLLYIYRHIDQQRIISMLADKYHMSETESRRRVKMAINTIRKAKQVRQSA